MNGEWCARQECLAHHSPTDQNRNHQSARLFSDFESGMSAFNLESIMPAPQEPLMRATRPGRKAADSAPDSVNGSSRVTRAASTAQISSQKPSAGAPLSFLFSGVGGALSFCGESGTGWGAITGAFSGLTLEPVCPAGEGC